MCKCIYLVFTFFIFDTLKKNHEGMKALVLLTIALKSLTSQQRSSPSMTVFLQNVKKKEEKEEKQ